MSDTINLLEEVERGCKMAVKSMEQISDYRLDRRLSNVIDHYKKKHIELQRQTADLLQKNGEAEKEPSVMASAMAQVTTDVKMFMRDDSTQVAKIMMNGCNMGIQSIAENVNKYRHASSQSVALAENLIKVEEDFMRDLKQFL